MLKTINAGFFVPPSRNTLTVLLRQKLRRINKIRDQSEEIFASIDAKALMDKSADFNSDEALIKDSLNLKFREFQ